MGKTYVPLKKRICPKCGHVNVRYKCSILGYHCNYCGYEGTNEEFKEVNTWGVREDGERDISNT